MLSFFCLFKKHTYNTDRNRAYHLWKIDMIKYIEYAKITRPISHRKF